MKQPIQLLIFCCLLGQVVLGQTNFFIAQSKYSGKLRIYSSDDEARPKIMTEESYWGYGWTDLDIFQTIQRKDGKQNQRIFVAAAKYEGGRIKIQRINRNGTLGSTNYRENEKGFNHVEILRGRSSSPLIFMARNKTKSKEGIFELWSVNKETGAPSKKIDQDKFGAYTHVSSYKAGRNYYLMAYHYGTGKFARYRLGSKGGLTKIKVGVWQKGWTSLSFFESKGVNFVICMNKATSEHQIMALKADGSFGKSKFPGDGKRKFSLGKDGITPGWSIVEPYRSIAGSKNKLFFYNERNRKTGSKSVLDNGSGGNLGSSTNIRTWSKGWTSIEFFRINKARSLKKKTCCPQANPSRKAQAKKEAALMLFYTDDKPTWEIAQRIGVAEELMTKNYSKSVLLTNKKSLSSLVKPSVKKSASVSNFFFWLKKLAAEGYYIDIYLIGHGGHGGFEAQGGTISSQSIIDELGPVYGKGKFPIRMVYQNNCWGSHLNQAFIDVGAKSVMGSRYVNFFIYKFNPFMEAWTSGSSFRQSIDKASINFHDNAIRNWVLHQKNVTVAQKGYSETTWYRKKWGLYKAEYNEYKFYNSKSHPIDWSSHIIVQGDRNLRKNSKPSW
ncbi:MAG: hypothetical protein MRZ79_12850 [Bacteroidia bacterium]|nr:hypothetical protein [Bacteroidia bacterium]